MSAVAKLVNRGRDALFIGPWADHFWSSRLNGKALCLCFHRVDDPKSFPFLSEGGVPVIAPADLKADILFLKRQGFRFITFDDMRKEGGLDPSRPHMILSFDDCYQDAFHNGGAVLSETGVKAVFFQSTGMVDAKELVWEHEIFWYCREEAMRRRFTELVHRVLKSDGELSKKQGWELAAYLIGRVDFDNIQKVFEAAREEFGASGITDLVARLYVTPKYIQEASGAGHEIASHGHAHLRRSLISAGLFEQDLLLSIEKLQQWTGRKPLSYAYPYGDYTGGDGSVCAKYFRHVVMTEPGVIDDRTDPFCLPRSYWARNQKNAVRRKRWLLTGSS